ncbi:MAG: hypothetical protein AB8B99_11815 [Phormidesmis sp.]
MLWILSLSAALTGLVMAMRLQSEDEIYAIAAYVAACLMALYGVAIAPPFIRVMLPMVALAWLHASKRRI